MSDLGTPSNPSDVSKKYMPPGNRKFKNMKQRRRYRTKRKINRANAVRSEVHKVLAEMLKTNDLPQNYIPFSGISNDAKTLYQISHYHYLHQIAFWKSKALAAEVENKILHNTIKNMCDIENSRTNNVEARRRSNYRGHKNYGPPISQYRFPTTEPESVDKVDYNFNYDTDSESASDIVDEEFMNILEKNKKFRMERDAKKNVLQEKDKLLSSPPEVSLNSQRLRDLKLLYGEDHKIILGLETSMQLHFDTFVEKRHSKMWPEMLGSFN